MSQLQPHLFPEGVTEGQVDSDFAIFGFANSFTIPQWVPEKRVKNCSHCKDVLKSNCTHNCRLCGNIFCSHCTAKYNLPERFEQKEGKVGPMRVCYGCKMSCIRMRQAALNLPLDSISRMISAPQWQDIKTYVACQKCAIKRRTTHNCRLCGILHCDDCTVKMNITLPPLFNKKNKQSPHRVCDSCRYRVLSGARIDDGSQQHIQDFLTRQQSAQDLQPNRFPTTKVPTPSELDGVQILALHRGSVSGKTPSIQTPTATSSQPNTDNINSITQSLTSLSIDSPAIDGRFVYGGSNPSGNLTPSRVAIRSQRYANAAASTGTGSSGHRASVSSSESGGLTSPVDSTIPTFNLPPNVTKDKPPSSQLEQLKQLIGSNATTSFASNPSLRKKIGGRDIFRALSTVEHITPTLTTTGRKLFEQSLDDQKEEEGFDEFLPPPPPPPLDEYGEPLPPQNTLTVTPRDPTQGLSVIDQQGLIKPSDLFGRLRSQQQQSRHQSPAYLTEDNEIANKNRQ